MYYLGVDQHKRYSQVVVADEKGKVHLNSKVANERTPFAQIYKRFGPNFQSVLEAGYNWGLIYDLLEELDFNPILGNPLKLRAIADAQIKTDSIDARTLANLLRAGLIPPVYVPPKDIRMQRNILRQRLWLVKLRTMLKNRIHQIVERNHVETSCFSDLFGVSGRKFLDCLTLSEPENKLLSQHLALLDHVNEQVKETETWIEETLKDEPCRDIIETIPGFGKILSALIALEIVDISRFPNLGKFASYCGLIPSTYASGGKIFHGNLVSGCNRWLRYAFIEGAWKAIVSSPYCRAYYYRIQKKKGANSAIVALARRLSQITYKCLKENRPYEERLY